MSKKAKIQFHVIRYKNFFSVGNCFIEIPLDNYDTLLVVGKNGSGKSTILEAIIFALYGKPFRNINKPMLVNSINEKDCLVEIEFTVRSVKYLVRRGIKPTIFEIFKNGVLLNVSETYDYQVELEKILGMNYKTFTQIVILGSTSFIPFMRLTPPDRRSIVENLLDIGVFSAMQKITKEKLSKIKTEEFTTNNRISSLDETIEKTLKTIEFFKSDLTKRIVELDEKIELKQKDKNELEKELKVVNTEYVKLTPDVEKLQVNINKKLELESAKAELCLNIKKLNKNIEQIKQTTKCETCNQPIDENIKASKIEKYESELAKLTEYLVKIESKYDALTEKINSKLHIKTTHREKESLLSTIRTKINIIDPILETLREERDKFKKTNLKSENDSLHEIEKLKEERETLKAQNEEIIKERQLLLVCSELLKDSGIKSKIISQYIPIINAHISKNLESFNFFADFTLDEEFKERIRSRHRDVFSYESFSEGEKQRIDLALLLTWRAIGVIKNSVNVNFLALDEVFDASMDPEGVEDFLKLLSALSKQGINIMVISHKGDALEDKFSKVFRFHKVGDFTRLEIKNS